MDNVMKQVHSFVSGLTSIFVSLLGLGVVAGLVFGNTFFVGDVVGNITALVSGLGGAGLVGLIVAIIIIHLLDPKGK
jgi:C4-dicarboxylate transporter